MALPLKPIPGTKLFFQPELDNGNISIVDAKGNDIGTIWWKPTGKYTVEVEHLEIDPAYQNRGLGEALLREFAAILPTIYPNARHLSCNPTSQGIVRLMRKVFGPELRKADTSKLPRRSPDDWKETRNRAHMTFRSQPMESINNLLAEPPLYEATPERIIACAVEFDTGEIGVGVNHGDIYGDWSTHEGNDIDDVYSHIRRDGFFTSHGRFVDRDEALAISKAADQYKPIPGEKEVAWLDYQNVENDRFFFTPTAFHFIIKKLGPAMLKPVPWADRVEEGDEVNPEHYIDAVAKQRADIKVRAELAFDDRGDDEITDFECQDWFKQASDEELLKCNRKEWGRDYEFDNIAKFMAASNPDLQEAFRVIQRDEIGFQVWVIEDDAILWIRWNRPHLLTLMGRDLWGDLINPRGLPEADETDDDPLAGIPPEHYVNQVENPDVPVHATLIGYVTEEEVTFECQAWFKQASDEELLLCSRCGWDERNIPRDLGAFEHRDIAAVFDEIAGMMENDAIIDLNYDEEQAGGYAQLAVNAPEAFNWIRLNRHHLLPQLGESIDDPEAERLIAKSNPPFCWNCRASLLEPSSVYQEWFCNEMLAGTPERVAINGHYGHKWDFVPDQGVPDLHNYAHDSEYEYCSKCRQPCWEGIKEALSPEDTQRATQQRYKIKIGGTYWFEYHCNEADDSCDAKLWYHSHQQCKVVEMEEPGFGRTIGWRGHNGHPASYKVQFADSFMWTAMEDELFTSRKQFHRPDPPLPPDQRKVRESEQTPLDDPDAMLARMNEKTDVDAVYELLKTNGYNPEVPVKVHGETETHLGILCTGHPDDVKRFLIRNGIQNMRTYWDSYTNGRVEVAWPKGTAFYDKPFGRGTLRVEAMIETALNPNEEIQEMEPEN
jgi:hypothetical protein